MLKNWYTSILMLQSSGSSDCTGDCKITENCSINELSIGIIKLLVSAYNTELIRQFWENSNRNIREKLQRKRKQEIGYLINTTHWTQHRDTRMNYGKRLCAQRIFIQLDLQNYLVELVDEVRLRSKANSFPCKSQKEHLISQKIQMKHESISTHVRRWYNCVQVWEQTGN